MILRAANNQNKSIFEAVKTNITARQVAERYGIAIIHNGMGRCPFHNDRIRHQLVEESDFEIDAAHKKITKAPRHINEKLPKGNSYYSVRTITLIPEAVEIIQKAMEINPDGDYFFMCHGRTINNDTFNERLKKYCTDAGVPYLSSHKLRFTVASTLKSAG